MKLGLITVFTGAIIASNSAIAQQVNAEKTAPQPHTLEVLESKKSSGDDEVQVRHHGTTDYFSTLGADTLDDSSDELGANPPIRQWRWSKSQ